MENKLQYEYDYSSIEQFLECVCEDICGGGCEITHKQNNQFEMKNDTTTYQVEVFEGEDKIDVVYSQIV